MNRPASAMAIVFLALFTACGWGQEDPAPDMTPEVAPSHDHRAGTIPATALVVHVRNASTGQAAGGLPVTLLAEIEDRWIPIITAETRPDGTVTMAVPIEMVSRLRFVCEVAYQDRPFHCDPFELDPDSPVGMTVVTVYDPMPRLGLPWWTAVALATLFVLALLAIACRRSDQQLT